MAAKNISTNNNFFESMKKFLFIAAAIALVMGTAASTSAKVVKKTKRTKRTTQIVQPKAPTTIQQGMYTQEGVERLDNGDVSDLEMAFIQDLYSQYVFTGNIANESYFRYIKPKFTDEALKMMKDSKGNIDWSTIMGTKKGGVGFSYGDGNVINLGNRRYVVEGDGKKCYFEVTGSEGAYKISKVSDKPFK